MISKKATFHRNAEVLISATLLFVVLVLALFHLLSAYNTNWQTYSGVTVTGILVLASSNLFRIFATINTGYRARISHVCTVVDGLALFTCLYSFVGAYDLSPAALFKSPATGLIFVYVAIQGIKLDKISVFVASSTAITLFAAGIFWMYTSGDSTPSSSYVSYLTSDVVLLGAEFERLIYLVALSIVLGICAHNGQKLLRDLTESRDDARVADRAKSEFLANMSHEIRTPMNGVMGMAELLSKTDLNTKQRMFTDVIVKSGAALLTIINDILDFSKIDAGQLGLDPAPFKLADSIEDVATLVSSRLIENDVELFVRIDPRLPEMFVGDVGRIRQVVTNLLGNAVKFTENGHVLVEVAGSIKNGKENHQTAHLAIKVEDTGIGIPVDKLDKVFEKFSQVDESATRKHEGTGLGLAISSSLVKLMGGNISVESEVGVGSTFTFTIDLPVHGQALRRKQTPVGVAGARILIVDDNELNRSILVEQMTSWNFESETATSGTEALVLMLESCQSGTPFDAVILDYHMPKMNGADVACIMHEDRALANLPILMLTSIEHLEGGKTFSSLGIQGHLTKPARSSILMEMLVDILRKSRQGGESGVLVNAAEGSGASIEITGTGPQDGSYQNNLAEIFPHQDEAHQCSVNASSAANIGAQSTLDILVAKDNDVT